MFASIFNHLSISSFHQSRSNKNQPNHNKNPNLKTNLEERKQIIKKRDEIKLSLSLSILLQN